MPTEIGTSKAPHYATHQNPKNNTRLQ